MNQVTNECPTPLSFHESAKRGLHGLYVITDERAAGGHEAVARAAIAGGASVLQLRDKSTPADALLEIAHNLRGLTRAAGVLLLINDDPQLALACDADGVHLGPDDISLQEARRVLGPNALIGVSCGDVREAKTAEENGADYIGAGAIFSTQTKLDAGAPIGLGVLRAIVDATSLPVAAIGGIAVSNIASVRDAGAKIACVISAVTNAENETEMTFATRALVEAFENQKTNS